MIRRLALASLFVAASCGTDHHAVSNGPQFPPGCPEPGNAAIRIISPTENQVVATDRVDVEFEVQAFLLLPSQDCLDCEDCGEVEYGGPSANLCGMPPMTTIESPVAVTLHSTGGECPIPTDPGPLSVDVRLIGQGPRYSDGSVALIGPPLSDSVTVSYQPD